MNEIINKFLLTGDPFMPEIHLKQPGFTYNVLLIMDHNHLIKKNKEFKDLWRLEIQTTFPEMN